jgi:hypothetical protein
MRDATEIHGIGFLSTVDRDTLCAAGGRRQSIASSPAGNLTGFNEPIRPGFR